MAYTVETAPKSILWHRVGEQSLLLSALSS